MARNTIGTHHDFSLVILQDRDHYRIIGQYLACCEHTTKDQYIRDLYSDRIIWEGLVKQTAFHLEDTEADDDSLATTTHQLQLFSLRPPKQLLKWIGNKQRYACQIANRLHQALQVMSLSH